MASAPRRRTGRAALHAHWCLPHSHEPSEQELLETKAKLEQQVLERDQAIQRMSSEQELRDAKTEQVQQALVRKAGEALERTEAENKAHAR
jgi:hypothetical protein